jgi:hypothetical protein
VPNHHYRILPLPDLTTLQCLDKQILCIVDLRLACELHPFLPSNLPHAAAQRQYPAQDLMWPVFFIGLLNGRIINRAACGQTLKLLDFRLCWVRGAT